MEDCRTFKEVLCNERLNGQREKTRILPGPVLQGVQVTSLILANLGLALIMAGIKFLGWDYATWTDFSSYSSYPWLMIFGVMLVGFGVGFVFSLAGAAVSALFGDKKGATGGKSRSRPKPQSNRRTTI